MVKKIFIVLITVVVCVLVGAVVLNVLAPNVITTLVDAVEDQIYRATSLKFDFNGNGTIGGSGNGSYSGAENESDEKGATGNTGIVEGVDG